MNDDFVQLLNRKGDIKVYKNIVISSNPSHLCEECSYYDEKVYNVFDLLNKLEEKDKEIGKLKAKTETAYFRINKLCEILYDEDYLTTYNIMQLQTALLRISEGL